MKTSLESSTTENILLSLNQANQKFNGIYPLKPGARQPVHTVYGGANLFKSNLANKLGQLALRSLNTYGSNFSIFAKALNFPSASSLPVSLSEIESLDKKITENPEKYKKEDLNTYISHLVYNRVLEKLSREPVEDFRIDFEDGYGNRPDEEEDAHAVQAAEQVAEGMKNNTLPPFIGIRIKPFTEELKKRGLRTLDIFLTKLSELTSSRLPEHFVVTLPKVTIPEQVTNLVLAFEELEKTLDFVNGSLKVEVMIETTQSIIDKNGSFTIPSIVEASNGRCSGCHFGTYDYTASCDITATYQSMQHDTCDFAKHIIQISLAGRNVMISDGATTIMPIGPYRASKDGSPLSKEQLLKNEEVVHDAWRLAFDNVMHSLKNGFYQGWDLNPAQLPIRYAAVYLFFLSSLEDTSMRLQNFIKQAAQATLSGNAFDDAATGQGLLNYFIRAFSCGAISSDEIERTGLTLDEIQGKSFVKIVEGRR